MADVARVHAAEDGGGDIDSSALARRPYELLFEMAADGAVMHEVVSRTARGNFIQANPAICRLLGYSLDEMRTLAPRDIIAPEEQKDAPADAERLRREGALVHRKTLIAKDGRKLPVEISSRLFDHNGKLMVMSVIRNLTERERAGRALREIARRFRTTFENAAVGIAQVALDGRFIRLNQRFSEITGYPSEELTQKTFQEITHPDDLQNDLDQAELLASGRIPSYQMEKRYLRKDRSIVWVNLTGSLQRNDQGQPEYFIAVIEDISERRAVEESVRRLAQFPEENPNPVLRISLDGTLLYANSPATSWLSSTCVGGEALPREALALVAEAAGHQGPVEAEIADNSGRVFWFAVSRPTGENYVNLYGRNVTERKRTEEALRGSEESLKRSQEIAHLGSWELDLDSNRLTWSDEAYRIFGLRPQEFAATYDAFLGRVHPDDRAAVDAAYSGSIRDGRDTYEIEHRVVRRDTGEIRIVHEKCEHFRDESGRIVRSAGMVHDVTERKRAEMALAASEARYRTLFETMTEGFALHEVICDEQGQPRDYRFLQVNPAFERQTGLKAADIAGRTVREVIPQIEPIWIERYGKVALTGAPDRFESWSEALGRWYDVHAFRTEPGRFAVIFTDVTDRKLAEQGLKELNETLDQRVVERTEEVQHLADRLRALAAELSQVEQRERKRLSGILHDHIQQLLVAARMQLALVKRDPTGPSGQAAAQGVDSILKEAIEASRSLTAELSPPILHEAGLVAALNWLAVRMAEKNQFRVHVQADNSAEPALEETRFLLFECVRELLFNALKHSGVSEAHVLVSRANGGEARIMVRDDGKGFDPASLRGRDARDPTFGLFSIQQRLAHLGGNMQVMSAPGKGTEVVLTAPIGAPPERVEGRRPRGATRTAKEIRTARKKGKIGVLLVDDHKIVREGLAGLLEMESDIVVVGEASDGPQAIELAERLKPDVVIMDINLGEMNGVEATRAILSSRPRTKIIGLSMHVDRDVATAMHEAGAIAYLTKGGPSEDLIDAIRASARRE